MINEDGKVTFEGAEQEELNRIVEERLARERKKYEGFEDLKEIETILEDFDYKGTPAEKKEALKAYRESVKQQQELAALEATAEEEGITPAMAKKMKALEDTINALNGTIKEITSERTAKDAEIKAKKEQEEIWNKQVADFNGTYADIDLKALEADEDFIEYATGRNGTLTTLYEGYVKFTSRLKDKTADEVRMKYKTKELLSTGTGKGSKTETSDYNLSERQKQLAKANGMTYKDYADLIKFAE